MISSIVMPVGMLVFGPLADIIAIEYMLIITGIIMLIEGILLLRNRTILAGGTSEAENRIKE